jgi:hypothetical protein
MAPEAVAVSKKRKADGSSSTSKKARVNDENAGPRALVSNILKDTKAFEAPDNARDVLIELATYARNLEQAAHTNTESAQPKAKSPEDIEAAAEKVRKAAASGIKNR